MKPTKTQAQLENDFLHSKGAAFAIYQLKDDDALQNIRFGSLRQLKSKGLNVDRCNYELVYTSGYAVANVFGTRDRLEELWERFSNEDPADDYHPSLSVSDIIVISQGKTVSCHYCDKNDFVEMPSFLLQERSMQAIANTPGGQTQEQPATEPKDRMREITARLEAGIKELYSSGQYAEYLKVMARFPRYSFRNTMLIFLQNPEATKVAGFGTWKQLGRSVNKGEKGLQILAPAPYEKVVLVTQDKDGKELAQPQQKKITVTAFKPVHVFDVSQTNGRELPELAQRLTGDYEEYAALLQCLKEISPLPIRFDDIPGGANGYCTQREIVIKSNLSQLQSIKTAIHEIAHAKLEHPGSQVAKEQREVQAESIAYITCQHLGIDSAQYTFGYLANWSSSTELTELHSSLDVIQKTASALIAGIEDKLEGAREWVKEKKEADKPQVAIKRFVHEAGESFAEVSHQGKVELYQIRLDGDKFFIKAASGRIDLTSAQAEMYKEWHWKIMQKQSQVLRVPGLSMEERLRAARAVCSTQQEAAQPTHNQNKELTR